MSSRYGGKIVTDGLILCLDAHDAKSYAGEPITNLVTSTAVDFSVRSGYTGNTFSQVADSESPSGYACEMSYTGTVNSASRCRFGASTNIPTSGTGFVSIWAKRSAGTSTMRPKVYTGYAWYHLEPLDGGSIYFTDEYRPFGVAVTFGTNSGGPNPGFSMTHAGGSTANDRTRWIKPQVTTLSYNTSFANLSRSATDGWVDRSGNSNSGTLTNMAGTGASHYRDGQVIMPVANSYLDFDGSNDEVDFGNVAAFSNAESFSVEVWFKYEGSGGGYFPIISKEGNSGNFGYGLKIDGSVTGAPLVYAIATGSTNRYQYASPTLSSSNWYHVCATFDASAGYITLYLNGSQNHSGSYYNQGSFSGTQTSNNLEIGTNHASARFTGKVASAKIYSKVLTAAEVLSNYNTTKGRFS